MTLNKLIETVTYTLVPKSGLARNGCLVGLDEITRSCLDKNSGKLNSTFPRITVQQRAQHCSGAPPAVTAAARLQPIVQCNVL